MAEERGAAVEHGQAPHGPSGAGKVAAPAARPPADSRLVAIAEILRPHGLSGDVRVRSLTDQAERFEGLGACTVWEPVTDARARHRVERVRRLGGSFIVKLAGVDGPEAARALAGHLLAIPEAETARPAPGYFYPWQLEGCRAETEAGERIGEVARIERGPAQDLWVVVDGPRERLIPAVPEIVITVDLRARRVVIRPPEGLLDL